MPIILPQGFALSLMLIGLPLLSSFCVMRTTAWGVASAHTCWLEIDLEPYLNHAASRLQLEARLAAAAGNRTLAVAESERTRAAAVAAATSAEERAEAAEAELEELRAAMHRSIGAAREEALGAMDTVGEHLQSARRKTRCSRQQERQDPLDSKRDPNVE